jgi:predicted TIM-barrel fold metal-dependent hydrolase
MCGSHRVTPDLPLGQWHPKPMVQLPSTNVAAPRCDVIDAHNHLGRWLSPDGAWMAPDVGELLDVMDHRHVRHVVNLDGRWGNELQENLDRYDRSHPDRFSTFCHLDWSALSEPRPTAALIKSLTASHAAGARGLKVWKDLGLHVRDHRGALVMPDDRRLLPVWEAAGQLGLPLCIHVADPVAFFEPLDERNERIDELGEMPEWWFGDHSRYPTFMRLMESLEHLVAATPGTRFMGAHVGCYAENLGWVGRMLSTYPNFAVDIGGRLGEIGRQPRRFRQLVNDHPRQVIFGTDCFPVDSDTYALHYRWLETADEHFQYWAWDGIAPQGRWHVSGADLPAAALRKLYAGNAKTFLGIG